MLASITSQIRSAAYVCRGCGTLIADKSRFRKCPVCGIKLG
jgi:rubrerythrin